MAAAKAAAMVAAADARTLQLLKGHGEKLLFQERMEETSLSK